MLCNVVIAFGLIPCFACQALIHPLIFENKRGGGGVLVPGSYFRLGYVKLDLT